MGVTIVYDEDYLRTGFDVNRPKQLMSQWCPRYPWKMTCHAILFNQVWLLIRKR